MFKFILLIGVLQTLYAEYVEFTVSSNFDLGWEIKDEIIEFTFKCKVNGYCGLGFGPNMNDVDMIVAIRMNDNVYVWDTWSLTESEPPQDIDLDGTDDIDIISIDVDPEEGFTAVFSRPLDTGDEYDKKLEAGMTLTYCWATYDEERFVEHNHNGRSTLTLGLTQTDSSLEEGDSDDSDDSDDSALVISFVAGLLAFLTI